MTDYVQPTAFFTAWTNGLQPPNVCVRKILLGNAVVDGHLDTCATHCFVSSRYSRGMSERGNHPLPVKPFPVGQGNPLPDVKEVHISSIWLISEEGQLVGLDAVLFLVCNTGADILIANNVLEYLGIFRYKPPSGYEQMLEKASRSIPSSMPLDFTTDSLDKIIREGKCMMTKTIGMNYSMPEICHHNLPELNSSHSKPGEPGTDDGNQLKKLSLKSRQELRSKKIQEAANLVVGKEPPFKNEIAQALDLLRRIAEEPTDSLFSQQQLDQLQKDLSINRPEWFRCLTPAHTQTTSEEALWAKHKIEEMMDSQFRETVFGKTLEQPCSFPPFEIHLLPNSKPERSMQPRRFKDPKITKLIDDWTDNLIKEKLIQKSTTPVASPVTVVLKKNREPRICIDYRERNARTNTPVFPMPDVHDFLDDAAGFKIYCSFDCTKMFNQYEIVPEHRHLAAFMTQKGTFEPTRILFGLTGGPQHAVRSVRPALREHEFTNGVAFTKWAIEQNNLGEEPPYQIDPETGIVPGSQLDIFIDDCRIKANTPKAMVKLCELWFRFCEEKRLILSRKKAKICLTYLPLLGFVVSSEGKHLDPKRISSLLEVPRPTSKEGLHALLCSYNFVRMFVPNFSSIAAPLYAATKGIIWKGPGSGRSKGTREFDPEFQWTEILDRGLRQLQDALLAAPVLVVPDYNKALFLSVDASLKGEGWVLWQISELNSQTIPLAIHYGSYKYNDPESTWEVTRQEAHAIQSALYDCWDYLFHCHFYLLTDHRNLTFVSDSANRAVIRIRHFMQQFNMTVVHVPGDWNNPADGLSRLDLQKQTESCNVSSTSMEAKEGFNKVSRGVDATATPMLLDDNDQVKMVSATVLCTMTDTTGLCQRGECLLCNPGLVEELDEVCSLLSSGSPETEIRESLQGVNPMLDRLGWEILEETLSELSDAQAQALISRASHEIEAIDWNRNLRTARNSSSGEEADQVSPDQDESGVTVTQGALGSTSKHIDGVSGLPDQSTQTTPADFRAARCYFPHLQDFKAIHNGEEGHHGFAHTFRKLLTRFGSTWAEDQQSSKDIKRELKEFIENCPVCQKVRGLQDKVKSKHSFILSRPFLESSYDFIVFDKADRNNNRYIIVIVDNFTKLVEMKAVPDRGAEGVALFLLEVKSRYGPIHRLRSDREKAFTSQVISKLNEFTGSTVLPCVAYHPQANSICERQNQIIMNHLRGLVYSAKLGTDSMFAWSDLLPFVYSIVNNTPKLPLTISPLSMIYGIFSNYEAPLLQPRPTEGISNPVDFVDGLVEWQTRLLEKAEEIQSRHYGKFVLNSSANRCFQEGDFVLQLKKSTGVRGKLVTRWIGPKLVLSRRDNDPSHSVLDLFDLVDSKLHEASIDDCRLFKTGWFDEETMLQDMKQLAALDKEEYEVEAILEHKPEGAQRAHGIKPTDYWFRVKWAGFSDDENSWEPYSALKDLQPLEEYLTKFPNLKL